MVTCEQLWDCYCSDAFLPMRTDKDKYIRGLFFGKLVVLWSWDMWREASFMKEKRRQALSSLTEFSKF